MIIGRTACALAVAATPGASRRAADLAAVDRIPLARIKGWTKPGKIGQIE